MSELNLESGQLVGGYTLLSRLGSGAMGSVWRVRDDGGHEYAMKILRDSLAEDDVPPESDEARERLTARERLRREAMALRRVHHPGVCGIVDMELDDSLAFIVTELIEGKNLRDDVAANGRYVGDDLERLARKLIDAVKAVHAAGIIHRDIKPTNVMVSVTGPVLVDFGIAMGEGESHVTRTGLVMGTPGFIAPEIIDGAESDEATDWWSVASVLAFAATGSPVFGTKPMMTVLERAAAGRANLAGLPPVTMEAFRSALDPDRSKRCTPDELLQAIERDALDPTAWEMVRPFDATSPVAGTRFAADQAAKGPDTDNPRTLWADADDPERTTALPQATAATVPQATTSHTTAMAAAASRTTTMTVPLDAHATRAMGVEGATLPIRTAQPAGARTPAPAAPPAMPPMHPRTAVSVIHPVFARHEALRRRGLAPVLLAVIPVALLAGAVPFAALALALALLWAALTAGLNADSQFRRELRNDGERKPGDGLRRAAALPWHLIKGLALAIARVAPMALALGCVWLVAMFTTGSPDDMAPTSAAGLALSATMAVCWTVSVLALSPDTIRTGAATLCRGGRPDAGIPDDVAHRPRLRTVIAAIIWILATVSATMTFSTASVIDWFPLMP